MQIFTKNLHIHFFRLRVCTIAGKAISSLQVIHCVATRKIFDFCFSTSDCILILYPRNYLGVVLLSNILYFSGSSPCRNLFCPVRTPKKLKKASMKPFLQYAISNLQIYLNLLYIKLNYYTLFFFFR